jgi:hypothetical protein
LMGAKSLGLVLIVIPGKVTPVSNSLRLAACFMTFSRLKLSPNCLSTWTSVRAWE